MDLAQFVSDYMAMLRDNGTRKPARKKLIEDIQIQYADTVAESDEHFEALRADNSITSEIDYLLS